MKRKFQNMAALAEHIGLSRSTVSYILNGKWKEKNISEATAQKVLAFVEESGFVPNFLGLALKGKANTDIAILLPVHCHEHQRRAFFCFLESIESRGLKYMVFPLSTQSTELTAMQRLKNYGIGSAIVLDGIADLAALDSWQKMVASTKDISWFFYDFHFEICAFEKPMGGNSYCVGTNRKEAMELVFRHIASSGYKNVVIPLQFYDDEPELLSFISDLGLSCDTARAYKSYWKEMPLVSAGRQIASDLLSSGKPSPGTAVFIKDDLITMGAIGYLVEHGARVPEDYSFISWDGLPESEFLQVPLTTLMIPHDKMLTSFNDWLEGKLDQRKIVFASSILPGKSLPKIS